MISADQFVIVGENLHATRVVRRKDSRVVQDKHGREAISFIDAGGTARALPISDEESATTTYAEGRIKHVRMAIRTAMGDGEDKETALAYLRALTLAQVHAGAGYLDLNVDEVSLELSEQVAAMRWLTRKVASWTELPVAVDSPNIRILSAGIEEAVDASSALPMVNSASLERLDALELAVHCGGPLILSAAGAGSIPSDADGRVENAGRMVELAQDGGVTVDRIYIDPLVPPISVDSTGGGECLSAYRRLRDRFGPEIHLTGGLSNVSFGLPHRRLLNETFLMLAIEAGADSGLIDPVTSNVQASLSLQRESRPVELAVNALTGHDRGCRAYMSAHRAGELEPVA